MFAVYAARAATVAAINWCACVTHARRNGARNRFRFIDTSSRARSSSGSWRSLKLRPIARFSLRRCIRAACPTPICASIGPIRRNKSCRRSSTTPGVPISARCGWPTGGSIRRTWPRARGRFSRNYCAAVLRAYASMAANQRRLAVSARNEASMELRANTTSWFRDKPRPRWTAR